MTSATILGAMYADADIVLVDRGLFDALCWVEWYQRAGCLTRADHRDIGRFLRVRALRQLTDLVLVMTVEPEVALERERATRPQEQAMVPGTIMNVDTLLALNSSIAATVDQHRRDFKLHHVETTTIDLTQTLDAVASAVEGLLTAPAPGPPGRRRTDLQGRVDRLALQGQHAEDTLVHAVEGLPPHEPPQALHPQRELAQRKRPLR
jgi:hypothetical protein